METKLSPSELVADLAAVMERVQGGERFIIEFEGRQLAVLAPPPPICGCSKPARKRTGRQLAVLAPPPPRLGVTGRDLAEALHDVPRPDNEFADDLEAIHASQGLVGQSA